MAAPVDVETWLTGIKPALAEFATAFSALGFDDTDDIADMRDKDVTLVLGECDAKGIRPGHRNKLEKAIAGVRGLPGTAAAAGSGAKAAVALGAGAADAKEKNESAVRSAAATAASAAASGAASLIEEGVDTVVDNL
eukprot:g1203.t1